MSKWASPIVIVPKKSAPGEPPKRRLCVDFRKVNELQQEDITAGKTKGQISIHPLHKIDKMYAKLKGAKDFSTIDLRSSYHHITLGKSSRAKTAFVTPFGSFFLGRFTDEGAGKESFWITDVCHAGSPLKYTSHGGNTNNGCCRYFLSLLSCALGVGT